MKIFEELQWRGLIKQTTSPEVENLLNSGGVKFYCGFDPTADSLHIGSLMPLVTMRRLQMAGNTPIALIGGFTASIGDPSFKSQERKQIDENVILENSKGVEKNIKTILDCEIVNNMDWFSKLNLVDFFRTVGKSFSVNEMLAKESVRSRLEDREQGISFTEFSYMLFQGYDFTHLCREKGVTLQVSGQDQYGNIVTGTTLTRKMLGKEVFGLTSPLITKSDGTKFGKTEGGNVWLSPNKTSPFDFYQFFVRVEDTEVIQLLKFLTFLPKEEIEQLEESLKKEPQHRRAQKALAYELTKMVHGDSILQEVLTKTSALFQTKDMSVPDLEMNRSELLGKKVVDLLFELKLSASKTMARKDIEGHAISVNDKRINSIEAVVENENLLGTNLVVQKGKKQFKVIRIK